MIVYKSITSDDVVPVANASSLITFKKWLEYLDLNKGEREEYLLNSEEDGGQKPDFESGFEQNVFTALVSSLKGYEKLIVRPQFPVGSYRIDLAILEKRTKRFLLGIEVDGYRYHAGIAKRIEDAERQNFIEAKGYEIHRITEMQ